ncbi:MULTISPECIES: TauD/TfdA family dioxygenase [Streptomyces]|uniref:TauD/TfdA family dioxygenase n=1 Tax=Streptomyces TaxID=1883 RepID=UPI00163C26B9|nr:MULTISPECIES: TauD/TfdA family dioxygenase [Streptomyces]MBC2873789.1 TauD/TfdA family dioxygenase [Streptomyces sp. TYQ1024]UBI37788.1 TauD/TfdA family dioxygenase [Streptomyces mobaraensis]UKW30376.1 TauD/TfdA family dioxygenase [Streptomyces sp. TYQ1024]
MSETGTADRNGFIAPPQELEEALIHIACALPPWGRKGTFLADTTVERYRATLNSAPLSRDLIDFLRSSLGAEAGGYAVLRLRSVAQALGLEERFLRVTTALLAEVATPFQPFRRWPLWKTIGTDLAAKPGMSTGIGYNAFHMDLVNVHRPPDFTVLLCVRPDPLGAGASIVSDARAAVSRLAPATRSLLEEPVYRYGSFFELSDVGEEYAPFPVLDNEPAEVGFVRFSAKMLTESDLSEAHTHAAKELAAELIAGQVTFTLQRGDVLIVNQHRSLHGREPLADGQENVPGEERRVLLQLFLRSRR